MLGLAGLAGIHPSSRLKRQVAHSFKSIYSNLNLVFIKLALLIDKQVL